MTTDPATEAGSAFRRRILSERTALLAARGLGVDALSGLLPAHLLCEASGQLFGLLPAMIEAVLPFGCHPVPLISPSAAGTMLGLFSRGGHLYSVIELVRLLASAPAAGTSEANVHGGSMLLLRAPGRRVALRVDRVLGLAALRRAGSESDRRAILPEPTTDEAGEASLISLIDAVTLHAAIERLDAGTLPPAAPRIPPAPARA